VVCAVRITIFVSSLAGGGIARLSLTMASGFADRGHAVSVATFDATAPDFYEVPPRVERIQASTGSRPLVRWFDLFGNIRRLARIRAAIVSTKPDCVISIGDGTNELMLFATVGSRFTRLVWVQIDHTAYYHHNAGWNDHRRRHFRRWAYRMADAVVFLSPEQSARAQADNPRWRCADVPDPVIPTIDTRLDEEAARVIAQLKSRDRWLVGAGRLVEQKGFDLLLPAFASLAERFPAWGLLIFGEGPDRQSLQRQAAALRIADRVLMPGVVKKLHAVLQHCDIFVLSSRFEGQPLVLMEAMLCGLPVVSFDCPSGPASIIRPGVDGLLVRPITAEALSAELSKMMSCPDKRRDMGRAAPEVKSRFGVELICAKWEKLIARCSVPHGCSNSYN
jgi:GalNAc-alpha-(1->4)-GalNAc-alpha-(1->3)-diNAcBac-PP-undecaprenol alpha-1,4-N-acetyl-D-galactosaminyltransferase